MKYTIIFGKHSCKAVLDANKREIYEIYISNDENLNLIPKNFLKKVKKISLKEMEKLVKLDNKHQNIAIKTSEYSFTGNLEKTIESCNQKKYSCFFILDEIQDPQNFGSIIRNAAAFNIDAIITTHHKSCPIGIGVLRASIGYSEFVNLIESKNLI